MINIKSVIAFYRPHLLETAKKVKKEIESGGIKVSSHVLIEYTVKYIINNIKIGNKLTISDTKELENGLASELTAPIAYLTYPTHVNQ